jgi:S-adenosylmethionine decarboxylase
LTAAQVAGATILLSHTHHFTPNGGVTGIALLSESHISIHTWPEFCFAAIDIYMCGSADVSRALESLKDSLRPDRYVIIEHHRGAEQ